MDGLTMLASGTRLGSYKILSAIGAGGMGEVYKARDTRLDRVVAIKILSPEIASAPDLRERFEREARTVGSLNHPHICTLYDIGQQDGTDFLVMEYLDGETLEQRLKKSALPSNRLCRLGFRLPMRSPPPTARASCTGTSSLATSCSCVEADFQVRLTRNCSISGWPRRAQRLSPATCRCSRRRRPV